MGTGMRRAAAAGWLGLLVALGALAADPAEKDRNYHAAVAALKAGDVATAAPLLEAAAKDHPASMLVAYARGFLAEKAGRPADALEQYRYALALYHAVLLPDEADGRAAETVRGRLRELSPGTLLLLTRADVISARAKTLAGTERLLCEVAAADLRHLAVGEATRAPPGPAGKAPHGTAP